MTQPTFYVTHVNLKTGEVLVVTLPNGQKVQIKKDYLSVYPKAAHRAPFMSLNLQYINEETLPI